jgi:transcriptional regulator with XRE-family HTH domain
MSFGMGGVDVAEPVPPAAASLARRLRELRRSRFPDTKLNQKDLARALSGDEGVAVSTISAWENIQTPTLPPPHRLKALAQFYATERSLEDGADLAHLVPLDDLSPAEQEAREELEQELFKLRDNDAGEVLTPPAPRQFWRFDDGASIIVICSDLTKSDEVKLGPLSDVDNPNYTELYSYADLDALVALLSHLNSSNPDADIRWSRVASAKDLSNHLVVLGGIAWNDVTRRLDDIVDLPIRQIENETIHSGEVFETKDGQRQFRPRWRDKDPGTQDKPGVLLEDVGMLARLPNPYNELRTLTYCNGIHSRGVLGAVRSLTDPAVRADNEGFIEETFPDPNRFALLMRVRVFGGETEYPSLKSPGTVLFKWSGDSDDQNDN